MAKKLRPGIILPVSPYPTSVSINKISGFGVTARGKVSGPIKVRIEFTVSGSEIKMKEFDDTEIIGKNKIHIPFMKDDKVQLDTNATSFEIVIPIESNNARANKKNTTITLLFKDMKVGPTSGT